MSKTSRELLSQPAFVLAIDHRNSLRHWYLALTAGMGTTSWTGAGEANADAADAVARRDGASDALTAAKLIVADGLLAAVASPRAADRTGAGQTAAGQAGTGRAGAGQTGQTGQAGAGQARAGQAGAGRAGAGQTGQAGAGHVGTRQGGSEHAGGGFPGQAMLLVDEEYGQEAIRRLRDANPDVQVVIPAERSGEPEFSFEHGAEFGEYILKTGPDIVKALVRYNPGGDQTANARSRAGLAELTRWLDDHGLPLMLELLVPPTPEQASAPDFSTAHFDTQVRPELTVAAIRELSESGLAPAFWKVEGQPSTAAFGELAAATDGGRCLVLGRGEDAAAVDRWVAMAAAADGFSGFAVGRTIWAQALGDWLTGQLSRDDAVAAIAGNYLHFVRTYLNAA
jgi:myo-inositol catabolism protein IolC